MKETIMNIASSPKGKIALCLVVAIPVWIIIMLGLFNNEEEIVTKTTPTDPPTSTTAVTETTTTITDIEFE